MSNFIGACLSKSVCLFVRGYTEVSHTILKLIISSLTYVGQCPILINRERLLIKIIIVIKSALFSGKDHMVYSHDIIG